MSDEHEPIFGIPPDLIRGPESDVLPLAGEINWGVPKFQVDRLRDVADGSGIIVGVVDTGVDRAHPLLTNCFAARDFTGSRSGANDVNGHGSHVTGTIGAQNPNIGMAPGCRTVHGKALDDSGSGAGTWIAAAMQWCADQGAEIISMSLGSSSEDPTITAKMRQLAEHHGIWIVAAAGNSGGGTPNVDWPGRSPWAISVAALNRNLTPASFSSAGAKIDTSFAGVDIWSCRPGGGYASMSGTSMATPAVAGVLALYRSGLKKQGRSIPTVAELRSILNSDSTDTHTPGVDRRTGPGFITPLLLALDLAPEPPQIEGGNG